MPAYSALTTPQKTLVEHAVNSMIRAELGRFQIALNHLLTCLNEYNGNGVGTILATVSPTSDVVPNSSGLSGSGDVTVADVTGMVTAIQAALTTYNTANLQQVYAHWAGGPNVIG